MNDNQWTLSDSLDATRSTILEDFLRVVGDAISASPDVTVYYRPGDGERIFQMRCVWDFGDIEGEQ